MRKFLVAFTASCSNGIMTDIVYLYDDEKATSDTFETCINAMLKPSYVKNIISWSLIEED